VVVVVVGEEEREKRLMCNRQFSSYFTLLIDGKSKCDTTASVTQKQV